MRRTNIYLDDRQLVLLKQLGAQRGQPVAGLVRAAVEEWLERQGARVVTDSEWQQRFDALLARRARLADRMDTDERQVAADIADAVAEVRSKRARAGRH